MILLFEEYQYPKQRLNEALSGYDYMCTELRNGKAKVQYVGYFSQKKGMILYLYFLKYSLRSITNRSWLLANICLRI